MHVPTCATEQQAAATAKGTGSKCSGVWVVHQNRYKQQRSSRLQPLIDCLWPPRQARPFIWPAEGPARPAMAQFHRAAINLCCLPEATPHSMCFTVPGLQRSSWHRPLCPSHVTTVAVTLGLEQGRGAARARGAPRRLWGGQSGTAGTSDGSSRYSQPRAPGFPTQGNLPATSSQAACEARTRPSSRAGLPQ